MQSSRQSPRIKRLHAGTACEACRRRKSRCDGQRPNCSNCRIRAVVCEYPRLTATQPTEPQVASQATRAAEPTPSISLTTTCCAVSPTLAALELSDVDGDNASQIREAASSSLPSGHEVYDLQDLYHLPDRMIADRLLTAYFLHTHLLYPVVHQGQFRAQYETIWDLSAPNLPLSWYGLLNMIFAHASEMAPVPRRDDIVVDEDASAFVARARHIIQSQILLTTGIETVRSILLMCYYLQGTPNLEECWRLVGVMSRAAVSIGLHTTPSAAQFSIRDREVRKRTWWACVVLDRTLSMKLARPPALGVDWKDVDLPLEVDDEYVFDDTALQPVQPQGSPSILSFFLATIRLSQIAYNLLTDLYLRGHERYNDRVDQKFSSPPPRCNHILSRVLLLDGQLQSWWQNVPRHLTTVPTEPGGIDWTKFRDQQIDLRIRFLHVRLLLHRQPYLYFTHNRIDDDFLLAVGIASARACIDCAHETINLIDAQHQSQGVSSLACNAQYVFSSMHILSVLQQLTEEKRSQLSEDRLEQDDQTWQRGFGILQAASSSDNLAARFVSALQQLNRGSDLAGASQQVPADNSNVNVSGHDLGNITAASTWGSTWMSNPWDPVYENPIDFDGLDAFLLDADM